MSGGGASNRTRRFLPKTDKSVSFCYSQDQALTLVWLEALLLRILSLQSSSCAPLVSYKTSKPTRTRRRIQKVFIQAIPIPPTSSVSLKNRSTGTTTTLQSAPCYAAAKNANTV